MTGRQSSIAVLAILCVAFFLRVLSLGSQEFRGDEVFGLLLSEQGPERIIKDTLSLHEPHPTASYLFQNVWTSASGDSEFAVRFLSTWFGTLAVALCYRLSQALRQGPIVALAGASFLALSPYAIWHSQDARMYSMSLALTLASMLLTVIWMRRPALWIQGAYLGVTWLALHTHYYAVFIVVAQNVYVWTLVIVERNRRLMGLQWLVTQTTLVLLYLPWLIAAQETIMTYQGNGDSPALGAALVRSLSVFVAGEAGLRIGSSWWMLAGAAGAIAGFAVLASGDRPDREAAGFLAAYWLIPLAFTWWGARDRPIFDERYLAAAVPPFYILLAVPLKSINILARADGSPSIIGRVGGLLPAFIVTGGMLFGLAQARTNPQFSKTRGWRDLAVTMDRLACPLPATEVRLAQNYPDPTLWYYYDGEVNHLVLPPQPHDEQGADQEVRWLVDADVQRIVLADQPSSSWDSDGIARSALLEHFLLVWDGGFGAWDVFIYARPPAMLQQADIHYRNGIVLEGYAVDHDLVAAGCLQTVYLSWAVEDNQLTGTETVFVQVLDRAGRLVAQHDRPLTSWTDVLPSGRRIAGYGILLPDNLAAGEYSLIAGLYDPRVQGTPRMMTTEGLDHVELAHFTVTREAPGDAD